MMAFHCHLCSKGYSRMNDYEAHLSSYDHTHRQRLKDMKAMVKNDPVQTRKSEAKADGIVSIKLGRGNSSSGPSGFKNAGFKKAGFAPIKGSSKTDAEAQKRRDDRAKAARENTIKAFTSHGDDTGSDTGDEDYEVYDPRFPTD